MTTWTELKTYVQNKEDLRYIKYGIKKYVIWLNLGGIKLETEIFLTDPASSDQIDFETNYKNMANFASPRKTEDGGIVVGQTYGATPETAVWKKRKHYALAGQTTFFDIPVTTEIRLRGGSYKVININDVHEDDYLEFSVIDKDNVLGLFSLYGLTVGVDVLELHKFIKTEYIDPEGFEFGNNSWSAFLVYTGLYLRAAYNSNGTQNINFYTRILWFE